MSQFKGFIVCTCTIGPPWVHREGTFATPPDIQLNWTVLCLRPSKILCMSINVQRSSMLFCPMTSFALVLQKKLFIKKMRKNTQNFHKHSLLLLFYFTLIVSLYKNDKTELIKKNLCFRMCFPIFKPEAFSP